MKHAEERHGESAIPAGRTRHIVRPAREGRIATGHVTLHAEDGHELDAYVAQPAGEPLAALVVVQEIFGVNAHIRSVVDGWARDGFLAIAPSLFDRLERGIALGYTREDVRRAVGFSRRSAKRHLMMDTAAAIAYARHASGKKTGVIGYSFGGTVAWLAACRLDVDAAVGYYGGHIADYAAETPRCPVMLHFGRRDEHISMEKVSVVRSAHPDIPVFLYDAGHGFNCDVRADYDAPSAKLARKRSLVFLRRHLA